MLSSSINNTFVITSLILMFIFLLIIGLLANVLIGAAKYKAEKDASENNLNKKEGDSNINPLAKTLISTLLILSYTTLFAQDGNVLTTASSHIPGLSNTAFYLITGVLGIELLVIMVLLLQLRSIIKKEKTVVENPVPAFFHVAAWKKIWGRLNAFRPREREPELDLGHDYDGIRELDNRLPPWWLYGFYLTIIVAALYLWRYHVAESAPLSIGEYDLAMQKAAGEHEAYLKRSASLVDENTVTMLSDAEALIAGKKIFEINCAACHGKSGEGTVGPNLTDDYWMHGGSIQDIFKSIKYGWSEKGMKSWKDDLSPVQIAQISTYIKTLTGTNPPNAKEKQGELYKEEESSATTKRDSSGVTDKTVVTTH
ncbi:MAG: c-type cytochrome [Chitinophagaceae bacterium]|nr:MAG: c-type cytochrome [Chitinophagaceae bacterium]